MIDAVIVHLTAIAHLSLMAITGWIAIQQYRHNKKCAQWHSRPRARRRGV